MTRRLVAINLAVLAALLGLVEAAGQLLLWVRPSYEVLFLEPDRDVGWKQVPGLRWRWGGSGWYARDFLVEIETNASGFRDRPRELEKPVGVVRLALLGDSLVEAIQVPLAATAGQILERTLAERDPTTRHQVLNFGISNYGVGQCLLVWEAYARRFAPDLVFVLVGEIHMLRSVVAEEIGAFTAGGPRLRVRPIFRLEDGTLVREPAADFAAFVTAQQELARSRFGPDRSRRATQSVLWRLLTPARARRPPPEASSGSERLPSEDAIRAVNARILEELGRQVRDAGARLVLVDVARYLRPGAEATSDLLDRLAREQGFGYVDLSPPLLRAEQRGEATRWLHDRHWNERGNEIFAAALARWIERDTAR